MTAWMLIVFTSLTNGMQLHTEEFVTRYDCQQAQTWVEDNLMRARATCIEVMTSCDLDDVLTDTDAMEWERRCSGEEDMQLLDRSGEAVYSTPNSTRSYKWGEE